MGLTKVDGFDGEAEILGGLHRVQFSHERLIIEGIELNRAYEVLDRLSAGTIQAVRVSQQDAKVATREQVKDVMAEGLQTGIELGKKMGKPADTFSCEVCGKPAPNRMRRCNDHPHAVNAPQVVKETDATAKAEEKPADPIAAVAVKQPEKVAEKPVERLGPAPPPGSVEMPDNIAGSKRFIEVMNWAMDAYGLKPADEDKIIALMETLRPKAKIVERVRDMGDKVKSNLAGWKEAGEAGEAA